MQQQHWSIQVGKGRFTNCCLTFVTHFALTNKFENYFVVSKEKYKCEGLSTACEGLSTAWTVYCLHGLKYKYEGLSTACMDWNQEPN
jgi:hypothetical protein